MTGRAPARAVAANGPEISIIVPTIQGWPAIARHFETWRAAAAAAAGELIVADGSGRPPPPADVDGSVTSWLSTPGDSVFQLRAQGYARARAPIVAITEDHCRVAPDWATRLLAAFAANRGAFAIGGSVENGATANPLDWASYLVVQAANVPPIRSGPVSRLSGAVNVAYRRDALASLDDFDGLGAMDDLHQRALRRSGGELVADDSIRVRHDQSMDWRAMSEIHFHAGRTYTGFLRRRMDGRAWLRVGLLPLIPYARLAAALRIAVARGYGRTAIRAMPAMLWLLLCQGAGQMLGFATGPGDSPNHIQ